MPASTTYNELKLLLNQSERAERQLHRMFCTIPLPAEEYLATRQKLLFLRDLGSSLAVDDQQRRRAVPAFTALSAEVLAPLLNAEIRVACEVRLDALQRWAVARVAVLQERGVAAPQLPRSARLLNTQFSYLLGFARTHAEFDAEERARIVEGLLASFHDALYNLLGAESVDLPPVHTGGTPPCSVPGPYKLS